MIARAIITMKKRTKECSRIVLSARFLFKNVSSELFSKQPFDYSSIEFFAHEFHYTVNCDCRR